MKVILRKNVDTLGQVGDIVTVKDGYGRNYLLPQNLAMPATSGCIKVIEKEQASRRRKEEKVKKQLQSTAGRIRSKAYVIYKKAGEEDKLYGSVTTTEIAALVEQEGFNVDKKKIDIPEPIHTLGVHYATIKLGYDIETRIKVRVEKES